MLYLILNYRQDHSSFFGVFFFCHWNGALSLEGVEARKIMKQVSFDNILASTCHLFLHQEQASHHKNVLD